MDRRESAIELVTHDNNGLGSIPETKPKDDKVKRYVSCRSVACLVTATSIFVCSFFLLFIMIPISLRIEDKEAVNATLIRGVARNHSTVILAEVDALWHWEVIVSTNDLTDNEMIDLFLALVDKIETNRINYTGPGKVVYAVEGSVMSSSELFSVQSLDGSRSEQCTDCSIYRVAVNGYYDVVTNSSDIQYSIVAVSDVNGDEKCTLLNLEGSESSCELEFDKIEPYYVIAQLSSSYGDSDRQINLYLSENGRRTWYTLLILLVLPIVFSGIALFILCIVCIYSS